MFKINEIVWDAESKEYVMVSNGIPINENESAERFITPTEAIALRVCHFGDDAKPRIAFTYRQVKPQFLSKLENPSAVKWFDGLLNSKQINKHFNFLGRV